MKHSLTVVFITARKEPKLDWFLESLFLQSGNDHSNTHILVIDSCGNAGKIPDGTPLPCSRFEIVPPKPTVWQGPHRLTSSDWWAISNARNTGICLCKTEWIAFVDDRSVLLPGWLNCINDAMRGDYAVNGSYEKVHNLIVDNGVVKSHSKPGNGKDPRLTKGIHRPVRTYGGSWFGCNMALPLEWCLEINGFSELCNGLGLEDVVFGQMLARNGRNTMFDPRMRIVEDRTPSEVGEMPKRTDKGPFATINDKSHKLLEKIGDSKRADNLFEIRELRNRALAGEPWPIPTGPTHDWFDGESLADMYVR